LGDREPDRALDIAGDELVAALEPRVEPVEHMARLLAGVTRALDGDMIAALFRNDAQPALDQRQVLSILAEQQRRQPIVVVGERNMRRSIVGGCLGAHQRSLIRVGRAQRR